MQLHYPRLPRSLVRWRGITGRLAARDGTGRKGLVLAGLVRRPGRAQPQCQPADPGAGRHERAHFADLKRFSGDLRTMLNVTEAITKGFLTASALIGSMVGAMLFGFLAQGGRKRFYGFDALILEPVRRTADVISWSIFRRRHQAAAKTSHYARQALTEP